MYLDAEDIHKLATASSSGRHAAGGGPSIGRRVACLCAIVEILVVDDVSDRSLPYLTLFTIIYLLRRNRSCVPEPC